jgi:DNA-directed RNA polymerase specialized sigma24 family protein
MTPLEATLAAGCSYAQAAAVLGISRDAVRMRAQRAGLKPLHRVRRPNPETARRVATARAMRAQGHSADEIGERLGMTAAAVRVMLRRAGAA